MKKLSVLITDKDCEPTSPLLDILFIPNPGISIKGNVSAFL